MPSSSDHKTGRSGPPRGARLAFTAVLMALAGLTVLSLVLVLGTLFSSRPASPPVGAVTTNDRLARVQPKEAWLPLAQSTRLTRIAFGSCLDQAKPQPIWSAVRKVAPQLFLMIGDNVYGDIKSPDGRELIDAYARQAAHPELAEARRAMPFLATWDDHDYGANDAGAGYANQNLAADIFRAFWQRPEQRQPDGGIYDSRIVGPPGAQVQIILLDTRSFRSNLLPRDTTFAHWGKYQPDATPGKTVLGDRQWDWLERELSRPANVRLIVSSIQVLAEGHGFERWGNLPAERARLLALISRTGAGGVVLLSGDRHSGARYEQVIDRADGRRQLVAELTSSSLNRPYGPSKDTRLAPLVSDIYHPENFGTVDIDWQGRTVSLALRARDGEPVSTRTIAFADLAISN